MTNDHLLRSHPGARHRLVLLHGWGADAEDLLPLGEALTADLPKPVELVALRAPDLHPQGVGRQWYALYPADWSAVPAACQELSERLRSLTDRDRPLERTVVLGFSQGAAMALASGCDLPLAGLIACSGYSHPGWTPPQGRPPVLLVHGTRDEMVPFSASETLQSLLNGDASSPRAELQPSGEGHTIAAESLPGIQVALSRWWT